MNCTLIILAAGNSSRYGNLKQFEKFGKQNAYLLEFGIYDAIKVGFTKIVLIIKEEYKIHLEELSEKLKDRVKIEYVIQETDILPKGTKINYKRKNPLGTAHAIWCCKNVIKEPFAIINSDDYYGFSTYYKLYNHLQNSKTDYCLIGYKLKNTLSNNGSVNRGICSYNSDYYLDHIVEGIGISDYCKYPKDSIVSMNMWGFQLSFMDYLEREFKLFLEENKSNETAEFFIPLVVDKLIQQQNEKVKIIETDEKWIGITYKEDKDLAEKELDSRNYPDNLWKTQ